MKEENDYNLFYYIPLIFLVFPILGIFWFSYPAWTLILTLAFTVSYLYLVRSQQLRFWLLAWSILLAYVAYMTFAINFGMIWYLFFISNLLVYRFKDRIRSFRAISFLLLLAVCCLGNVIFSQSMAQTTHAVTVPIFCLAIYLVSLRVRIEEEQMKAFVKQNAYINILAAENERNRIGRDLHDTLGHVFSMITIKTELALKQLEKGQEELVHKELAELHQISRDAMKDVRNIVNNLKYRTVSEELEHLSQIFAMTEMTLTVENQLNSENLSPVIQSSLTMILRELTNNVIKHSQASSCHIKLWQDEQLMVSIEDDGVGFKELSGDELSSIRERLSLVKGKVEVVSLSQPAKVLISLEEGEQ